ncbi:MAG TPA: hypothetical protein VMW01_10810 [Williamwhitmania sp.]|nr:hypothetical protein [Williamwhitmania sp.]
MQTMSYSKSAALILFHLFLFQNIYSQENYTAGYIVSNKNDTLHGFIDYRNWEKNPHHIYFKEKLTDEKVEFLPTEIRSFSVSDEVYVGAIVNSEISPFLPYKIDNRSDLKFEVDTTFLQTIIGGIKSLYLYKNNSGKTQFYIKVGPTYELLIYKMYQEKYYHARLAYTYTMVNQQYLSQLASYLGNCPLVSEMIKNTTYSRKDIENLFFIYYKCEDAKIEFQKKPDNGSMKVGIIAGISITSLKFRSEYSSPYAPPLYTNFKNSVNVSGGVSFDFVLARNLKKWSWCNELLYSSYKFNDHFNENGYSTTYINLEYTYLKIASMVRYRYPIGKYTLFFNGGFTAGYAIKSTNYRRVESELYGIEIGKAVDSPRNFEEGYTLGLGGEVKRYSVELMYEAGAGASNISGLNRYYILVGYRF